MRWLESDPKVIAIARDLGFSGRENCVAQIREHTLKRVQGFTEEFPAETQSDLMSLVAAQLSVELVFLRSNSEVDELADRYKVESPALSLQLRKEFIKGDTEGLLLNHPDKRIGSRRYLAIIDARSDRANRAYFTAWHELAHVLVTPANRISGVRRAPTDKEKRTDPEEAIVDHIAGHLAFYRPIFQPALRQAVAAQGSLGFTAMKKAVAQVAPDASLYAAARASLRLVNRPACFVQVDMALKESERQRLRSPQLELPLDLKLPKPKRKLRIVQFHQNTLARKSRLRIYKNMRVPEASVLRQAHAAPSTQSEMVEVENQEWWETSKEGHLPSLPLEVHATRRGSYVYGLILPIESTA